MAHLAEQVLDSVQIISMGRISHVAFGELPSPLHAQTLTYPGSCHLVDLEEDPVIPR